MIDTRTQLKIAVGAALFGILGVAGFGWRSLDQSSTAADRLRLHLGRIRDVSRVEENLHELDGLEAGVDPTPFLQRLSAAMDDLRASAHDDSELNGLATLLATEIAVQAGRAAGPLNWAKCEQLASRIERRAIRGSMAQFDEDQSVQASRARRLAQLGALTALVFSVLATVAYLRLRRERGDTSDRLRHNDRLAALGAIAASMAHELNNPLATIAGCAEAIGDRLRRTPGTDPDALEYIEMVTDETRRCTGIVNSLRDLARDRPLAVSNADLAELARDVTALVQMDRSPKQVVFRVASEGSAELVCDPDKIKQLLLNLLVNARDASHEGGAVDVCIARRGADLELEVRDHGRGIPRKELTRIFQAFHTDKTRGLGIGLFLSARIVELHGGSIVAASDGPDQGATFTIVLPTRIDERETGQG
jgi:signal transduction histidine kinase